MKISRAFVLTLVLALASSCAKKHWVPNAEQLKQAESVAKLHALQVLSDQAGTPEVMELAFTLEGPEIEYPVLFTFRYTPYSRYRVKYWGDHRKGVKRIHVLYFNPALIPDWENPEVLDGEFPGHFSVIVDMDALRVIEFYPSKRPDAP